MAASPPRSGGTRLAHSSAADEGVYEEWPYLDEEVLVASRSGQVCMTCHWFRHHAGANCIPVLTCQLHQGLLPDAGNDDDRQSTAELDLALFTGMGKARNVINVLSADVVVVCAAGAVAGLLLLARQRGAERQRRGRVLPVDRDPAPNGMNRTSRWPDRSVR